MNAAPNDAAYAAEAYPATTSALHSAYKTALGAEPAWTTWKTRHVGSAPLHRLRPLLAGGWREPGPAAAGRRRGR